MAELIHPSHRNDLKEATTSLLWAIFLVALVVLVKQKGWFEASEHFLSLHNFLEVAAISVAVLIFSVGWSTRQYAQNGNLLLLSCLMLAVALFDFSHVVSYAGMPPFITPASPEKAINFWLVARLFSALALIALALTPWLPLNRIKAYPTIALTLIITVALSYVLIFYQDQLPQTFDPATGLTRFKIISEYVLIALFLSAAVLFALNLKRPKTNANTSALIAASLLMVVSEFFFTLYQDVTDTYNFFGHVYKIIAYVYLYRAIFIETVTRPYLQLAKEVTTTQQQAAELAHEARLNESLLQLSEQAAKHDKRALIEHGVKYARIVIPSACAALYESATAESEQAQLIAADGGPQALLNPMEWQQLDVQYNFIKNDGDLHVLAVKIKPRNGNTTYLMLSDHDRSYSARDLQALTLWLESLLSWCTRIEQEEQVTMLSLAVEQNPNPIFITDTDARIEYVNKAYVDSSGYERDELMGQDPKISGSGRTPKEVFADMWRHLLNGDSWSGELINRNKAGDEFVELTTIFPIKDAQGRTVKYISFKNDVTKAIENEEKIHQLSYFDQLTGLPNRVAYQTDFKKMAASSERKSAALLYINLDNFKLINDAVGLEAGNKVLSTVSHRLQGLANAQRIVYRLSGDVFAMLLTTSELNAAAETALRVLNTVRAPMRINGQMSVVTASIGVTTFMTHETCADEVLQHAEVAMYEAKKKGRNTFQIYSDNMHADAAEQLQLLNALNFALERNEFSLVYQPQVNMRTREVIGAEALLRWRSAELGEIPPGRFIPLAERSGLIASIDRWVFRQVAKQIKQWQQNGCPDLVVAVNVSASRFEDPDLVRSLKRIVEEEQVAPELFELELTEVVALQNPEQALTTIAALRAEGFHVSLDDFGTGYSSISYLKRFGLDKLKIDKSFIDDLSSASQIDIAIVRGIIALAKSLNMIALAEGVETEEQWQLLLELGCDEAQGYLYSRPLDAQRFCDFTHQH
ncbi:EAL domain-containing protein [Pseudidiomarina sp. YC-516-91]|uniref:bifunctional diguanylate cyclase/phosphodiesterase n=1 Tax=Pseudidiomarina salilacus TaxID=3384452 RepID=UPI003984F79F